MNTVKTALEIGFNAGHSAEIFLANNIDLHLTSFDLGSHDYVLYAKKYIDITFPGRHELILGDSTVTVPQFISNNPNKTFDIIFIDGGHDYNIARADMENCYKLANKDTIVMLDDTIFTQGWEAGYTLGPSRTWLDHIKINKIMEINRKDYAPGRGMSWGKYNMDTSTINTSGNNSAPIRCPPQLNRRKQVITQINPKVSMFGNRMSNGLNNHFSSLFKFNK